jgi:hypothetical protein
MNRKRALLIITLTLLFVGCIGISTIFIGALKLNPKAENIAWLKIDVSRMMPGDVIKVDERYYVYRPPNNDSAIDKQYFIFNARTPRRGCEISYYSPGSREYKWNKNSKPYENIPHFSDECEWGIWDLNGKYIRGTGHPKEEDLVPRRYEISKLGNLLMHKGRI